MATRTITSAEEFETFAEQIGPCELVRGEIVRLTFSDYPASRVASNVAYLLEDWSNRSKLGRGLINVGVVLETDPDTVRGADVAYISYRRLPKGRSPEGFLKTPPELVVEIVGKGQGWGEMVEKASEYLRRGVDRVWIINPETRRLHMYRADAEPVMLSGNDRLSDEAILPGFSCRVEEFFAD